MNEGGNQEILEALKRIEAAAGGIKSQLAALENDVRGVETTLRGDTSSSNSAGLVGQVLVLNGRTETLEREVNRLATGYNELRAAIVSDKKEDVRGRLALIIAIVTSVAAVVAAGLQIVLQKHP